MEEELKTGVMVADTLENGDAVKQTAGAFCIILMETSTRDNGKMTEPAAKASTPTATEQGTQELARRQPARIWYGDLG